MLDGRLIARYEPFALCFRETHLSHEVNEQDNVVGDVGEIGSVNVRLLSDELSDTGADGARLKTHIKHYAVVGYGVGAFPMLCDMLYCCSRGSQ